MTRFLTIISGSALVGKTTLVLNLARRLKAEGKNPLVITEDVSWLSEMDLAPSPTVWDLKQLIVDRKNLMENIIAGPSRIDALFIRLARDAAQNLEPGLIEQFCQQAGRLEAYDYFLFDISGGLNQVALSCCLAPCDSLLVVTPEAGVLNQSLKLLNILSVNGFHDPLKLVVTKSDGKQAADETYTLLQETSAQRLHIPLEYVGYVNQILSSGLEPQDRPCLLTSDGENSKYFELLAKMLQENTGSFHRELAPAAFWAQLIDVLSYPLQMPSSEMAANDHAGLEKMTLHLDTKALMPALDRMIEHLGTIGDELAQIKHLMKVKNEEAEKKICIYDTGKDSQEIIPLDLDAFVEQSQEKKSND